MDYGAGNLFSVSNALSSLGVGHELVADFGQRDWSGVILPGVGHFGHMVSSLDSLGLRSQIVDLASRGVPVLGICLGMQVLFEESEEAPGVKGLGLLQGRIVALPASSRVPHMGWNTVMFTSGERNWFYFANSFVLRESSDAWGVTDYGSRFTSAVVKGNVAGVQFHPEKSGAAGLRLLFEWCADAC